MISRSRKIFRGVMIAPVCFVLAAYGVILAYATYANHRATLMLSDAARIRIGDSESAVQPIVQRYKGVKWTPDPLPRREDWIDKDEYEYQQKLKSDYNYGMGVSAFEAGELTGNISSILDRAGNSMSPTWRRRLGIRIWSSDLQISIRDRRVCSVSVRTLVEGRDRWLGHQWSLSELMPRSRMKDRPYLIGAAHLTIFAGGLFGGSAVTNFLTPTASDQEQHVARDFNRTCITGFKACDDLEELAPLTFAYLSQHPDAAWNIIVPAHASDGER